MHRGLPIWVNWFSLRTVTEHDADGNACYETTEEERQGFPALTNVSRIVLNVEDWRSERRGFRTFVVFPEGVADPDYEAHWLEWEAYKTSQNKRRV